MENFTGGCWHEMESSSCTGFLLLFGIDIICNIAWYRHCLSNWKKNDTNIELVNSSLWNRKCWKNSICGRYFLQIVTQEKHWSHSYSSPFSPTCHVWIVILYFYSMSCVSLFSMFLLWSHCFHSFALECNMLTTFKVFRYKYKISLL
jgi:hypothetical protein